MLDQNLPSRHRSRSIHLGIFLCSLSLLPSTEWTMRRALPRPFLGFVIENFAVSGLETVA
jgi:hypothetical protein